METVPDNDRTERGMSNQGSRRPDRNASDGALPTQEERLDYRLLHEDGDEETIGTHHGRMGNGYWPSHEATAPHVSPVPPEPLSDGISTTGDDSEPVRKARTKPRGQRRSDPPLRPSSEGLDIGNEPPAPDQPPD